MKVGIVSMGCSKNLVDSERLARRFLDAGIEIDFDSAEGADYAVINTCGFIGDAKEESIEKIMDALAAKERGELRGVYVMGCLSERYRSELADEIPELDGIYGKFDWDGIVDELAGKNRASARPWERELSTAPHYTYVKVSEGCNRFCAFCAIPLITGRHHSRPVDEIAAEVADLASRGTREFNIIAQDLSSYGCDIAEGRSLLAELVDTLAVIPGVEMLRLHYAYPADFPYDVLEAMARHSNVCRYLDIALQHIDDGVLAICGGTSQERKRASCWRAYVPPCPAYIYVPLLWLDFRERTRLHSAACSISCANSGSSVWAPSLTARRKVHTERATLLTTYPTM